MLGSEWERQGQIQRGLPTCGGNCFIQDINFQNLDQRALTKLKLNSNLGKWAQNQNKTQTTFVTTVEELYEFVTNLGTEVINLIFPNLDVVWLSWKYSEDNIAAGNNVNVAMAVYITTQARLKLYEYLSELGGVYPLVRYSAIFIR